jgi:hypothetical protein
MRISHSHISTDHGSIVIETAENGTGRGGRELVLTVEIIGLLLEHHIEDLVEDLAMLQDDKEFTRSLVDIMRKTIENQRSVMRYNGIPPESWG